MATKNNKPASAYAGRYKEGLASSGTEGANLKSQRVVAGNISTSPAAGVKTDGIKIRGTGAATKGTMARGPMA